jgi:hypothetical protein
MPMTHQAGFVSFADAEARMEAFETLLRKQGIEIVTGSKLEHGCLVLQEMHRRHQNPSGNAPWSNMADDLKQAVGISQLVELTLKNESHPDFGQVVEHLKQLNAGSAAQNVPASPQDQASNKVFELLVGLAVMPTGTGVQMDHPVKTAGGANPDVLASMPDRRRWGFACKVVHGDNPKSLYDNLAKGVDQIEKSTADVGVVVVSFKNKLPSNRYFPVLRDGHEPILGTHHELQPVVDDMSVWVREQVEAMIEKIGTQGVWETVRQSKALPGILVVNEAAVGLSTARGPVPSLVGFLQLVPLEFSPLFLPSRFDRTAMGVLQGINDHLRW